MTANATPSGSFLYVSSIWQYDIPRGTAQMTKIPLFVAFPSGSRQLKLEAQSDLALRRASALPWQVRPWESRRGRFWTDPRAFFKGLWLRGDRFLSVKILASRVSGGCFLRLLGVSGVPFMASEFSFAWYS